MAMSIINPQKDFGQVGDRISDPSFLKSCKLQTELLGLGELQ